MAIRFDIKKYEKVKQAYISQLSGVICPSDMRQCFPSYMMYLDSDKDVLEAKAKIRALKQQAEQKLEKQREQERKEREQKRIEKQKQEKIKRKELEEKKAEERRQKALQKKIRREQNALKERHYYMGIPPKRTMPKRRRIVVSRNISAPTKQFANINSYESLSFMMNSSYIETIKKQPDLDHLKRLINTYGHDHKDEQIKWLKKIDEKEKALELKEAQKPQVTNKYEPLPPKIIYTAMGGMTNYKRRR